MTLDDTLSDLIQTILNTLLSCFLLHSFVLHLHRQLEKLWEKSAFSWIEILHATQKYSEKCQICYVREKCSEKCQIWKEICLPWAAGIDKAFLDTDAAF